MKKSNFEKLNDGFVNLYEESLFTRCYEYSAILVSELNGYRLFANIDKKSGFVFLECGFPKIKLEKIIQNLENKGFNIRLVDKTGNVNETFGNKKLERGRDKIKGLKNNLINF